MSDWEKYKIHEQDNKNSTLSKDTSEHDVKA